MEGCGGSILCCSVVLLALSVTEMLSAPVIENKDDAAKFLNKYGYVPTGELGGGNDKQFKESLMRMQYMAGLNQTGELDEPTMTLMNTDRCAVTDYSGIRRDDRRRKRRYTLQGSRWNNFQIRYGFGNFTIQLPQSLIKSVLKSALERWAAVTPLSFIETVPTDTDIRISWERRDHGDGSPFDGRSGVLAHAFYPQYGGDAHFDDDEIWTDGTTSGTNLLWVAIHEFGHSLGLGHSNVQGAIMYPYYTGYVPNPQLTDDDISGIQYIYGRRTSTVPTTTSSTTTRATTTTTTRNIASTTTPRNPQSSTTSATTTSTTTRTTTTSTTTTPPPQPQYPPLCLNAVVDAMVVSDGITYLFSGLDYYVLLNGIIAYGYPRTIRSKWPQINGKIDAALYYPSKIVQDSQGRTSATPTQLFLFQNDVYYRYSYTDQLDQDYPRAISVGFPGIPNNLDAAFTWGPNGQPYFFKGSQYYRYSPGVGANAGYPTPISNWKGVPNDISAVFTWVNGRTYFFKGTQYYRFDDYNFKVELGYPRPTNEGWLGCFTSGPLKNGENENDNDIFIEIGRNGEIVTKHPIVEGGHGAASTTTTNNLVQSISVIVISISVIFLFN